MSTARKSVGGMSRTTLAEAITSAGRMNAASRHRKKGRGSITSLSGLTSDHDEISPNDPLLRNVEASGNKIFAKASAASKEKRPEVGPSSHAPSGMICAWICFRVSTDMNTLL